MSAKYLPRLFRYNNIELEDPGPQHDAVDVRNLYAATYPEITSAAIEGPEQKDGKIVYTFRRAVGTKGLKQFHHSFHPYRTQAHLVLHYMGKNQGLRRRELSGIIAVDYPGLNRESLESACSILLKNGLARLDRIGPGTRGGRFFAAARPTDTVEEINAVPIKQRWVNFSPIPSKTREPSNLKPGKNECLADYLVMRRDLGRIPTRAELISRAATGRRYEKLWPKEHTWKAFVADCEEVHRVHMRHGQRPPKEPPQQRPSMPMPKEPPSLLPPHLAEALRNLPRRAFRQGLWIGSGATLTLAVAIAYALH